MVTPVPELPVKVKKAKEKKSKKNKKEKKKKKQKKKKKEEFGFDSDNDDLDLSKELRPLADYADDPDELLNQIFSTIKGSKLTNMLPPVLRSLSIKELKKLCLHELEGMSHKRIICIINGEVLEDSSEEEEEDEEVTQKVEKMKKEQQKNGKEERAVKSKGSEERAGRETENDSQNLKDGKKDGKTSLDILELEMRAKIIKTMLERQGTNEAKTPEEVKALEEEVIAEEKKKMMAEAKRKGEEDGDLHEVKRSKKDMPEGGDPRQEAKEDSTRDDSRRRRRRSEHRRRESRDEGRKKEVKEEEIPKKRKKITRREFEERMKKAKQNRTYRRRRNSEEEEEQEKARELAEEQKAKEMKDKEKNAEETQAEVAPGESKEPPEEGEAVDSEKEEGEIDSEEEHEEGSCSPSDISSGSDFSYDSRSGSRKRSYSRSYSHSSRSGSYSSRSSRSRSRTPSSGRRRRRRRRSRSGSYGSRGRRSYPRRGGRPPTRVMSQGVVRTIEGRASAKSSKDDEEDNWGEKCDIEFIDSGDEKSKTESKSASRLKSKSSGQFEKVGISFAIQKKPSHSITNTLVLEDYLPPVRTELPESKLPIGNAKTTTGELPILSKARRSMELGASKEDNQVVVISDSDSDGGKEECSAATETSTAAEVAKEDTSKKNIQKIKTTISKELENEFVATEEESVEGTDKISSENKDVATSEKEKEKDSENEELPKVSTEPVCNPDEANKNTGSVPENKVEADLQVTKPVDGKEADGETKAESTAGGEAKQTSYITQPPTEEEESGTHPDVVQSEESDHLSSKGDAGANTQKPAAEIGEKVQTATPQVEADMPQAENEEESSNSSPAIHGKDNEDVGETASSKVEDTVDMPKNEGDQSRRTEENLQSNSEGQPDTQQDSETHEGTKGSENHESTNSDAEVPLVNTETELSAPTPVVSSQKTGEEVSTDSQDKSTVHPDDSKELKEEEAGKPEASTADNPEDFYRGAENLEYPEEKEEDEEEELQKLRNAHVEPIRIESGLIRRKVVKVEKTPLEPPPKSWLAKEKKKKEKTVETLALEGVGLLKSALIESQASGSSDSSVADIAKNEPPKAEDPATEEKKDLTQDNAEPKPSEEKGESILQDLEPEELEDFPDDFSMERSTPSETKRGKGMEIIGVLEPTDSSNENMGDLDLGGSSWSMRWLQSEKVQKVVTSSKMLSRVRKKIQKKEKAKDTKVNNPSLPDLPKQPTPEIPVIGSIEEYERLFGLKSKKTEPAAPEAPAQTSATVVPVPPTIPKLESDESEEDSEEEALWSKIMKK